MSLVPLAKTQFTDANGVPLAMGTVAFYVPSTSTPKDTFQDAALSSLNTNPVQLDAAGRAIIYGSGAYRQLVKDALGNTVWDQTVTLSDTFTAPGAGAVSRTFQNKMASFLDVKDFGAKGDGVTDDRASIQAALDAAGAAGGGTVVIPSSAGRYRITAGLKLPAYVTLQGPASSRYPFNAGNANSSAILADFATANQWVIEPKTTISGASIAYNVMVSGALPDGSVYNCAVRDLTITSTGTMPYGGIRMHGAPGSVVDNVAINNVGCGLLVNYSFGGRYSVHTLTAYYGAVAWDDANANLFEVYCSQQSPYAATVPAGYMLPFMNTLNGALVPTYKLATNSHYNRSIGLIVGSLASASASNSFDATIETFTDGVFLLFATGTVFNRCYTESAASQMQVALTAAQSRFTINALHAYLSSTGVTFDLGVSTLGEINPSGTILTSGYGSGPYLDTSSRVVFRNVGPDAIGPTTPQFNIGYPDATGSWRAPTYTNSWSNVGTPRLDAAYHLNNGKVEMRGAVNGGGSGTVAFTLPAGFRPLARFVLGNVQVDSTGAVTINATGPVGLDGIAFEASL